MRAAIRSCPSPCRSARWRSPSGLRHTAEPLDNTCVDPRFNLVARGIAPNLEDLNGRWAVPGTTYGQDILSMIKRNSGNQIEYRISGLEEYDYPENEWDCVISNLALHYIEDIVEIFQKVYRTLKPGGIFLFNIEHPVFTAGVGQDWIYTDDGKPQYWAIDNYFITGERNTHFLGCDVVKQHHTLTQIIMGLLNNGFELKVVEEAEPPKEMMDIPGMEDELRRPMMLLVKAIAKK